MVEDVGKILKIIADSNLFEEGVELIGSWCFNLYQKHLGVKRFPLRTIDIDFLIPNPFKGDIHKDFIEKIEALGFQSDFDAHGSLSLSSSNLRIDFITPLKGKGVEKSVKVKKLGFNAIPLRFVDLLLQDPIIVVDHGISIKVPNPINFCLHKLIVASYRPKLDKRLKDLEQAIYVAAIIENRQVREAFDCLPSKWRASAVRMLIYAEGKIPLLSEEAHKLLFTLQNNK